MSGMPRNPQYQNSFKIVEFHQEMGFHHNMCAYPQFQFQSHSKPDYDINKVSSL